MKQTLNILRIISGFILWGIAILMLLLSLSTSVHAESYWVWIDTGNGGQWVLVNPERQQKSLDEDWADHHLADPDTGFTDRDLYFD